MINIVLISSFAIWPIYLLICALGVLGFWGFVVY